MYKYWARNGWLDKMRRLQQGILDHTVRKLSSMACKTLSSQQESSFCQTRFSSNWQTAGGVPVMECNNCSCLSSLVHNNDCPRSISRLCWRITDVYTRHSLLLSNIWELPSEPRTLSRNSQFLFTKNSLYMMEYCIMTPFLKMC